MALSVPGTGLGSFGLAPPDSFRVKGKEGVLLLPSWGWGGEQFKSCSSCICVRSSLLTTSLFFKFLFISFFKIESLTLGSFHLA